MTHEPHLATRLTPLWRPDGVTALTVLLVLLLGVPSQLVLPGLGGAGSPALVAANGCLLWWLWHRVHRHEPAPSSPVLAAALLFLLAVLASYVVASIRPINAEESLLATLAIVSVSGWLGLLALAHDGAPTPERWLRLLDRMALIAAVLAAFGLFQFVTGRSWLELVNLPGLEANTTLTTATVREGFTRPSGTAVHAIEFGAVLVMLLPLTLARGMGWLQPAGQQRNSLRRWLPAIITVLVLALSLSRSALVGAVVAVVALAPAFSWKQRFLAVLGLFLVGIVVFLTVPGMAGTILGLFTGIGSDPGVQSRTDSYEIAASYIARSPWLGRGLATFLPRYRIFDNQYLLALVEIGLLGVLALLGLAAAAIWSAARARSRFELAGYTGASTAVMSSALVGAFSLAIFDGFSFPMMVGLWFVMLGLSGAAYRLSRSPRTAEEPGRPSSPTTPPGEDAVAPPTP